MQLTLPLCVLQLLRIRLEPGGVCFQRRLRQIPQVVSALPASILLSVYASSMSILCQCD